MRSGKNCLVSKSVPERALSVWSYVWIYTASRYRETGSFLRVLTDVTVALRNSYRVEKKPLCRSMRERSKTGVPSSSVALVWVAFESVDFSVASAVVSAAQVLKVAHPRFCKVRVVPAGPWGRESSLDLLRKLTEYSTLGYWQCFESSTLRHLRPWKFNPAYRNIGTTSCGPSPATGRNQSNTKHHQTWIAFFVPYPINVPTVLFVHWLFCLSLTFVYAILWDPF